MSVGAKIAIGAGAFGLALAVGVYALVSMAPPSSSPVAASTASARTQSQALLKSEANLIEPGQASYWNFEVVPEMKNLRVRGNFEASGGHSRDGS